MQFLNRLHKLIVNMIHNGFSDQPIEFVSVMTCTFVVPVDLELSSQQILEAARIYTVRFLVSITHVLFSLSTELLGWSSYYFSENFSRDL